MKRITRLRRYLLTTAAASVLLLLAGCGQFGSFGDIDVTPAFTPTTLGFEVSDDGTLTIASHVVTFNVRAGSIGGRIDGYEVRYFTSAGNPIIPGDSRLYSRDSLGVTLPSGIACAASEANNTAACSINDAGARFAPRDSVPVSNFITLPGEVAIEVLNQRLVGARAEFYLLVTTDLNEKIRIGPFEVSITYPVEGGG
ncbi:MAG: hypothetical protein U5L04_00580 [Trueperaceae bacterium]|nr:hypothetical protein [Trueperaceae bacterium]